MSPLPSHIESLLIKARADALAATRDFQGAAHLYEKARKLHPDSVEPEQNARLAFLAGQWSVLEELLPGIPPGRRALWQAVLEAQSGKAVPEPNPSPPKEFDPVLQAYLLFRQDKPEEARSLWMDYLRTTESSWERPYVGRTLLQHTPAPCCCCQEKPALAYVHDRPVCSDCQAFVEDEDGFLEAMKGQDPEKVRLIENLTGEPFEAQDVLGDLSRANQFPNWQSSPEVPVTELTEISSLLESMDEQALACWERAREMAKKDGTLEPRHLWDALLELPDSAFDAISPQEMALLRDAVPGELEMRWVLNLARWGASLFPIRESSKVSPGELLLAQTWTLPSKMSMFAARRAFVARNAMNEGQLREFERLLQERPDDLYLRIVTSAGSEGMGKDLALERILWFMRYHPERMNYCGAGTHLGDPRSRLSLVEAWCEALRAQPDRVGILTAAADFFGYQQAQLQFELHRRAAELEPTEFCHPYSAAQALEHLAESTRDPGEAERLWAEAVLWSERARTNAPDPEDYELLAESLEYAFEAKSWKKVSSLADQMLAVLTEDDEDEEDEEDHGDEEDYGDEAYEEYWIHRATIALGHAAYEQGDLDSAKRYLLASLSRDRRPQQDSYPPHMDLARKLLESGERESVLEYFLLCEEYWKAGAALLMEWTELVQSGEIPDFPRPDDLRDLTWGNRSRDNTEV